MIEWRDKIKRNIKTRSYLSFESNVKRDFYLKQNTF